MSSKGKLPAATGGGATLAPKLRFPEFRKAKGWKETLLLKLAVPVTDRATTGDPDNVLSLSGEHGLVLQSDYFGKKIAGESTDRYLKIRKDDFVYNDRATKASSFGTIKRLSSYAGGIVSPIYKCFRFQRSENPAFWEWYFESGTHDRALGGLVNEGARAGRFNISVNQFLSTNAWRPDEAEQQKIADCLDSVDALIAAQGRKVEALSAHKKGLMQQLFPQEGETQPRLRFPEFEGAGDWEVRAVGDVFKLTRGEVLSMTLVSDTLTEEARYPVYSSQTKNAGLAGYYSRFLYQDAITWTTDGANAGDVNFRRGKFFCTNVCGVLISKDGHANAGIAALLNSVTRSHVSYVGNPKLMNGVMAGIEIPFPSVPEQQRIAHCLTSLDDIIAAESRKLDTLKTHKKGLMQQLFPSAGEANA